MENLEKSWNFNTLISRPAKVIEKNKISKVLEKSRKLVIVISSFTQYEHMNMRNVHDFSQNVMFWNSH